MDHRANVYSPLQNTAIWVAAWLYGEISTDECLDALRDLGGPHLLAQPGSQDIGQTAELLRQFRAAAPEEGVTLQLALSGPGDAPGLRAGSAAMAAAVANGIGALIMPGAFPHSRIFVPVASAVGTQWRIFEESAPLPAPAYLSPGDADLLLADATRQAATLIESQRFSTPDLPNPRLTIGTLADFYDTPGLPHCTPPRAAKLFARADQVSAIIEAVTTRIVDHSLDPFLLPLTRQIRLARMAGVDYAVRELARL
ncbi:hypothetical protein WG915_01275 [Corynebacterium sp. H128]|uniref:hypothetical protein n=1 Tax=Corynebacterium sp. H128 TaxID=3133427 RepID=UPI0030A5725D